MKTTYLGTGLLAAIASSLCCIAPLLALLGGVAGTASTFSWIEPARPFLIGISVIVKDSLYFLLDTFVPYPEIPKFE